MEVPNWKTKHPSAGKWVSTQTTESPDDIHETQIMLSKTSQLQKSMYLEESINVQFKNR